MSIFNMSQVGFVSLTDLETAREFVKFVINDDLIANPITKVKATQSILNKNTTKQMAFAMSNWILAHPDENLKVL